MIPKSKIEEAAKYFSDSNFSKDVKKLKTTLFKLGVSFAEKELENLAIDFAEWINWCGWTKLLITNSQNWLHITGDVKTTKELFEIFKKEKYEHES